MLLVGYGSTIINNTLIPYWIARNSWGKEWGLDGYVHIKRGIHSKCHDKGDGFSKFPSVALGGFLVDGRVDDTFLAQKLYKKALINYSHSKPLSKTCILTLSFILYTCCYFLFMHMGKKTMKCAQKRNQEPRVPGKDDEECTHNQSECLMPIITPSEQINPSYGSISAERNWDPLAHHVEWWVHLYFAAVRNDQK